MQSAWLSTISPAASGNYTTARTNAPRPPASTPTSPSSSRRCTTACHLPRSCANSQAEGFTFRITGLKSALYRIRKKRTATAATGSTPGILRRTRLPRPRPGRQRQVSGQRPSPTQTADGGQTRKGWKTIEQLRAENPIMPKIQLKKSLRATVRPTQSDQCGP